MLAADFHLRPSRYYLLIFSLILYGSVVILCTLPIPPWLKLIGSLLVIVHGGRVIWRYALLRNKLSITDIRYTENQRWVIQNAEGTFVVKLLGNSTVTNFVLLLHFHMPGKMLPLKSIIFRDSLSKDDFRKLLVVLRNQ